MRMFLVIGLALFLQFSLTLAAKPNIVLVFIDDMGWGDFSCFGNKDAQTPQIDRLAREGVRFEQFYVNSPICSPSRTAISTGQYPQRWRITSYLAHRAANERRGQRQRWQAARAAPLSGRVGGPARGVVRRWGANALALGAGRSGGRGAPPGGAGLLGARGSAGRGRAGARARARRDCTGSTGGASGGGRLNPLTPRRT